MNKIHNPKELKIGIICGNSNYPLLVARACMEKHIRFCLLFLKDCVDLNGFDELHVPSLEVNLGEISKALNFFHENEVTEVVFAGGVKRPNFNKLSLDKKGASWMLKLGKAVFSGDDALLRKLSSLLEEEGFKILAGTDLLDDVFVKNGVFSRYHPSESDHEDIKKGFEVAKAIGKMDIGQSVVVCDGIILGVECVEGTDALIDRCAQLRKSDHGGILVKVSKPQQDYRLDLPTIGIDTINRLNKNGFCGVAVEAGKCIVINKKAVIEQVDDFSMFFCGYGFDFTRSS
ncbi:hypothetical protein FACS1894122_03670 [Alphaproteobacteria bacterium]|nr:hypothetical protein FACS1894122_03670 [Alphaproteobacteria bacterium]